MAQTIITIEVQEDEAALIARLRKFDYGDMIIHKLKGKIMRVEITSSELLNIMEGKKLEHGKDRPTGI